MLKDTLISLLNPAINRYLALDPEAKAPLAKLDGRRLAIMLKPFQLTLYGKFNTQGIELTTNTDQEPDVTISGTPWQLFAAMTTKDNRQQFFADDVSIAGNVELGHQIVDLFDHLQIDWEDLLAQYTGDVPAYHLGKAAQRIKKWLGDTNASLTANISDYLHEEANWLPTREALDDFFCDIDTLRMDTDRIDARIQQLQSQIANNEVTP